MNKNIPGNFNFFKALKYLKTNDQTKPFVLKDIKNEDNYNFYNQLNNGKLTVIQTQLTPSNSVIPNLNEKKLNYNIRKNPYQYEDKKNIENNKNDNENKYSIENTKNYLDNNINENSNLNHKRGQSQQTGNYKKKNSINYSNKKHNKLYTNIEEIKIPYSEFSYKSERKILNTISSFNSLNKVLNNVIRIEDILFISERLEAILKKINGKNLFNEITNDGCASHECFEYWTFYFDSSLLDNYTRYFSNVHHVIIKSSNNLELFCIILTYHLSLNPKYFMSYKSILGQIFPFIKNNLMLIIRKIINEIYKNEDEEYIQMNYTYLKKINQMLNDNVIIEDSEKTIISTIIENSKKIVESIKLILTKYQKENPIQGSELTILFNNISKLPNTAINEFFYDKIVYIPNKEGSITNTLNVNLNQTKNKIQYPYIKTQSNRKYSLILDLDETLVFVKFVKNKEKGILHYRPYLFDFLDSLFPFYELISFTTATKIYAEPILNAIESNKKYFSFKFYREHCIIKDKKLIKDISRLGRDMSKILLIDNTSHNFHLNKNNGILIYPFYNENNVDSTLLELKKILIKIYYKNYDDIRQATKDFKNEIIMKVSCNSNSIKKN